ncbi:LacI family DNA-binding transcriptional regulator [Streptococcus merionis]|uniref:Catabolite control protein n=1 Tax=Streptococcus merionis TaxID=400065 RepID=A0A239STZ8_9STRE|nr:LacI family DNA-binding transcriptional regulator [Streptococcus merionis]SNU88702.1 catabolite control protein [Streptococcus merionis]
MTIKKKNYTIYDIAKISGYSPKTVSRVINKEESVRATTREKIEQVIAQLAYSPNAYAKNLSRKATTNILISVKKKDAFPLIWFQTLLDKLLLTCKELGVNAIVEYFDENDSITNSIIFSSGSLVDGVIVFYESENDSRIGFLKKKAIPFIVFGKGRNEDVVYVSNDDFLALYQLFSELDKAGYRNVWMLMGGESSVNLERARGAETYIQEKNEQMSVEIVYGLLTIEAIYDYSFQHLINGNYPDVIFVSGDEKVQGLIRACYEKGIGIPQDIAVVGYDNIPISQYYTPALTTISPNYVELSSQLLKSLLKLIDEEDVSSVEIGTSLIKRQSTEI